MWLINITCKRTTGMGMKLMKFHAILHMLLAIYLFGVPAEQDTGANKSHHKLTKIAARLNKKRDML
jgi:hypothetical protein